MDEINPWWSSKDRKMVAKAEDVGSTAAAAASGVTSSCAKTPFSVARNSRSSSTVISRNTHWGAGYQPSPPWAAPQQPIDVRDIIHVPDGQLAPRGYVEYLPEWWVREPSYYPCGDNWPGVVREIVGAAGVDLAFDPVGGDRLVDTLRLMAPEGRLLVVGFTAGEIPTVKVNRLLLGNIGVLGAASREFFERQPTLMAELWSQYVDMRKTGALADPPIQVWPFANARQALQAVEDRRSLGKYVLSRRP
jgi:Zinc-binding dehydrogenase